MSCSVEGEATPAASEVKQDTKREVLIRQLGSIYQRNFVKIEF